MRHNSHAGASTLTVKDYSMKSNTFTLISLLLASQTAYAESPIMTLEWPQTGIKADKIEASGLLWDERNGQYLLVSDQKYDKNTGVFVINADGSFRSQLNMSQNTQINDLESISTDGEFVYILNSFSDKKSDTGKFIRFKYTQDQVTEQQEINLLDALKKYTTDHSKSPVAKLLSQSLKDETVDIESHLVIGNDCYIGLKAPRDNNNEAVFIKIDNVAGIFAGQAINAEIVLTGFLSNPITGKATHLSDMILIGNELFLLSTQAGASTDSYLWRYTLGGYNPKLVKTFANTKAEGITYNPTANLFVIVFDEGGGNPSKFQLLNWADI